MCLATLKPEGLQMRTVAELAAAGLRGKALTDALYENWAEPQT